MKPETRDRLRAILKEAAARAIEANGGKPLDPEKLARDIALAREEYATLTALTTAEPDTPIS